MRASAPPMSARPGVAHPLIRKLGADDIESMVSIENTAYPFPWTHGIFGECIRVGYACYGIQIGSELAGYAIYNRGAKEAHLLNLCVHPDCQGRGFGSMLLEYSIGHAREAGCTVMFLEVRPSNQEASRLYARKGFETIGRRPAYYQSDRGKEDAMVMKLDLRTHDQQL